MTRLARVVAPGHPHHVTQRGVRSLPVFADDDDRRLYLALLREPHLLASARYTEMNPVRVGVVTKPEDYRWSGARYHLGLRKTDPLLVDMSVVDITGNWRHFLRAATDEDADRKPAKHISTGRALGSASFTAMLEKKLAGPIAPRKRGWPSGKQRKHK